MARRLKIRTKSPRLTSKLEGLVLVAAVSPQIGAAFAVTLLHELGPAGAASLPLAFTAIVP
jgi:threonine/homoserine efflux transporter RhtA